MNVSPVQRRPAGSMTNLLHLADARARRRTITFDRLELNRLVGLYSQRVSTGEWRDYAIDFKPGMAVFSIFRHTAEQPLFSIVKLAPGRERQPPWVISSGPRRVAQRETLDDTLKVFDRQLRLLG